MHIKLGSPGIATKYICNCYWCTKVNTKVHNATKEENTIISFCNEASDFLSTFSHTVLVSAKGVGQYMVVPSGGRLAQLSLKAYCFVCIVVWYKHWGISSTMTTKRARWGLKSPVFSIVYSGADQRNHQSSASLTFVRGIHRSPVNCPQKRSSNNENVSIWWRHLGAIRPQNPDQYWFR